MLIAILGLVPVAILLGIILARRDELQLRAVRVAKLNDERAGSTWVVLKRATLSLE